MLRFAVVYILASTYTNMFIRVKTCASVAMESATNEHTKKDTVDEIKRFVNSRFITASEAMWRMFSFDVYDRDPSIQCLAVHEENLQSSNIS